MKWWKRRKMALPFPPLLWFVSFRYNFHSFLSASSRILKVVIVEVTITTFSAYGLGTPPPSTPCSPENVLVGHGILAGYPLAKMPWFAKTANHWCELATYRCLFKEEGGCTRPNMWEDVHHILYGFLMQDSQHLSTLKYQRYFLRNLCQHTSSHELELSDWFNSTSILYVESHTEIALSQLALNRVEQQFIFMWIHVWDRVESYAKAHVPPSLVEFISKQFKAHNSHFSSN